MKRTNRTQVIGSLNDVTRPISSSNPLELIVFDTAHLAVLDSVDGVEDSSIEA